MNGQLLIDNWTNHAAVQNSGTIALAANQKYNIRLDYYERGGGATIRLSWAYPGQTSQVVPQSMLFPVAAVNQPPAVNAGPDQTITRPSTASLTGVARDDGLPNQKLTIQWSKISGRETPRAEPLRSAMRTRWLRRRQSALTVSTFCASP